MRTLADIRVYPTATYYITTIEQLGRWINDGTLLSCPAYRGVPVWSVGAQINLINNVLKGWALPGIIICEAKDPDHLENGEAQPYHLLDGLQRLITFRNFLNSRIPATELGDEEGNFFIDQLDKDGNGRIANVFRRTEIHVVQYDYMDQEAQFKIFNELHKDMALANGEEIQEVVPPNAQEVTPSNVQEGTTSKIHELISPWTDFARGNEASRAAIVKLSPKNKNKGFSNVIDSMICMFEFQADMDNNNAEPCWHLSNTAELKWNNVNYVLGKALDGKWKENFEAVFSKFAKLVEEHGDVFNDKSLKVGPTFTPVEVFGTAVMVYHRADESVKMLAGRVTKMREDLVTNHPHARRANKACWVTVMQHVMGNLVMEDKAMRNQVMGNADPMGEEVMGNASPMGKERMGIADPMGDGDEDPMGDRDDMGDVDKDGDRDEDGNEDGDEE